MISDDLQFAISQYLDGQLPAEQAAVLEKRLETDAEAREVLAEYRRLDGVLKAQRAVPEIDWGAFAARVSDAVADADEKAEPIFQIGWQSMPMRLAMAACVLIAIGASFAIYLSQSKGPVTGNPFSMQPAGEVRVLVAEAVAGEPRVDVSIGPAPTIAGKQEILYHLDSLLNQSSLVMIQSADGIEPDRQPY